MKKMTDFRMLNASLVLGGAVLALTACGDDVTEVTNITHEVLGVDVAETADSLSECNEKSLGKTSYVQDESVVYVCAKSGWTPVGEMVKGTSCYVEILEDSSAYKVVCGGDSVGVLVNGLNGSSCLAESLSDGSGYKVVCGGDSVGVVLNGQKGADADGACTLSDDGEGTLTQTCGENSVSWYKAVCGTEPYEPEKSFCHKNSVYDLCGGKAYNPDAEFCYQKEAWNLCGKMSYDPLKKFCDDRDSSLYTFALFDEKNSIPVTIMAENLHYKVDGSYCKDNDTSNCALYGRYYSWDAATEGNVCPTGWHLPDTTEWNRLKNQVWLGSNGIYTDSTMGKALKSKSGWSSYVVDTVLVDGEKDTVMVSGNGESYKGFNALPVGIGISTGAVLISDDFRTEGFGNLAYFWTSTSQPEGGAYAYIYYLAYNTSFFNSDKIIKSGPFLSVRCIKDDDLVR